MGALAQQTNTGRARSKGLRREFPWRLFGKLRAKRWALITDLLCLASKSMDLPQHSKHVLVLVERDCLKGSVRVHANLSARLQVLANVLHLLEGRSHSTRVLAAPGLDDIHQVAQYDAVLERLLQSPRALKRLVLCGEHRRDPRLGIFF